MESRDSKKKDINLKSDPPLCPICGQPLRKLLYTEYGMKKWTTTGWQESDTSDSEWHTGCCDAEIKYDDLLKLGVF